MSRFNDANDLASQAVFGEDYDGEPCDRTEGVTVKDGVLHGILHCIDITGRPVNHHTWAELATELQAMAEF
jgi:hypothetical protein